MSAELQYGKAQIRDLHRSQVDFRCDLIQHLSDAQHPSTVSQACGFILLKKQPECSELTAAKKGPSSVEHTHV